MQNVKILVSGGRTKMALWSEVELSKCSTSFRLDPAYYRPDYLESIEKTASGVNLGDIAEVIHPKEIKRVYEEEGNGVQILLAQNVKKGRLDFTTEAFMPVSVRDQLQRNILQNNDVLMTRTGANFGDTALYKNQRDEIYACADVLILRPNGIPGGYLSAFFNSKIGRTLLNRGAYGAAQPHISLGYLNSLKIPRLSIEMEAEIDLLITKSYEEENLSASLYKSAQSQLVQSLGLDEKSDIFDISYVSNFSDVQRSFRMDAEYFKPKYQNVLSKISKSGKCIGDFATNIKRRFKPEKNRTFNYIEIGSLLGNGFNESSLLLGEDAPSRAQWIVESEDIITSTVRPIRRLTALIEPNNSGYVCSSGFIVLRAQKIQPELLLLYLRLPIICELLNLYSTASMYPAISVNDVLNLPITLPDKNTSDLIANTVRQYRTAWNRAKKLQEKALKSIEDALRFGGEQ